MATGASPPHPEAPTAAPSPSLMVGTINLLNRTRYGFTARGVPCYVFNPLDDSEAMTPFRVGCSLPPTENMVALVRADKAAAAAVAADGAAGSAAMMTLPRGNLVQVLGPSGDKATELKALEWLACPFEPFPDPAAPKGAWLAQAIAAARATRLAAVQGREQLDWPCTFNIDNLSTRDIDDTVSIRALPPSADGAARWEFAISIADVASCVPAGSPLDDAAFAAAQTLYSSEGTALRPMLPRALSEGELSLAPGVPRLALALFFTWIVGELDVGGAQMRPVCLTSSRSFAYETVAEEAAAAGWGAELGALGALARVLGSRLGLVDRDLGEDPHTWIEALMLYYNTWVGRELRRRGSGGLLRRHAPADATRLERMSTILGGALRSLAHGSASYCPAGEPECRHWGLSADFYAHASSPIRRYCDLHNQRVLLGLAVRPLPSGTGDPDSALAEHLDARGVVFKRFARDSFLLEVIKPHCLNTCSALFLHVLEEGEGEGRADELATPASQLTAEAEGQERQKYCYNGVPQCRAEFWVGAWNRVLRLRVTVLERHPGGGATFLSKDETQRYSLAPGGECDILAFCDLRGANGNLRKRLKMTVVPRAAGPVSGDAGAGAVSGDAGAGEVPVAPVVA